MTVNFRTTALLPGENPHTHSIGGWVGPRACLDGFGEEKIYLLPVPAFEPLTVQPVASPAKHYFLCCTSLLLLLLLLLKCKFMYNGSDKIVFFIFFSQFGGMSTTPVP